MGLQPIKQCFSRESAVQSHNGSPHTPTWLHLPLRGAGLFWPIQRPRVREATCGRGAGGVKNGKMHCVNWFSKIKSSGPSAWLPGSESLFHASSAWRERLQPAIWPIVITDSDCMQGADKDTLSMGDYPRSLKRMANQEIYLDGERTGIQI